MKISLPLVGAVVGVAAIAACNQSKLVAGACSAGNGVSDSSVDVSSVEVPGALPAPVRPIDPPVYVPGPQNAAAADAVPATAQMLIDAMDLSIETTGISLSAKPNQAAAFAGLGVLQPATGSTFAWLSTGVAGAGSSKSLDASATATQNGTDMGGAGCPGVANSHDCAQLTFSFVVPIDQHSMDFDFIFLSSEFPEYVNLGYNDAFTVKMTSPSHNIENIVYDGQNHPINIDSVLFTDPCTNFGGTGFDFNNLLGACDAGATGLLTTQAPVEPGEPVTLTFTIYDMTDKVYDSAVMLDNFRFGLNPVSTPITGTPTPTPGPTVTPTPTPGPTAAPTATPCQ